MKKKLNPITAPKRNLRASPTPGMHVLRENLISKEAYVEELREELKCYREDEKNRTLRKFIHNLKVDKDTYHAMLEDYPKLKVEHLKTLEVLGERLWLNAVDRKADWGATKFRIHRYGKEFLEDRILEARLSKEPPTEEAKDNLPATPAWMNAEIRKKIEGKE